jgi:hypothetical protein
MEHSRLHFIISIGSFATQQLTTQMQESASSLGVTANIDLCLYHIQAVSDDRSRGGTDVSVPT